MQNFFLQGLPEKEVSFRTWAIGPPQSDLARGRPVGLLGTERWYLATWGPQSYLVWIGSMPPPTTYLRRWLDLAPTPISFETEGRRPGAPNGQVLDRIHPRPSMYGIYAYLDSGPSKVP